MRPNLSDGQKSQKIWQQPNYPSIRLLAADSGQENVTLPSQFQTPAAEVVDIWITAVSGLSLTVASAKPPPFGVMYIDAIISPDIHPSNRINENSWGNSRTIESRNPNGRSITLADISYFKIDRFRWILFCFLPLASCDEARRTFNILRLLWLLVFKRSSVANARRRQPAAGGSSQMAREWVTIDY